MNKFISYVFVITCLFINTHATAQSLPVAGDKQFVPWETIRANDILWHKRVWRHINVVESANKVLRTDANIPGNKGFANILLEVILSGKIKAYTGMPDSGGAPLTRQDVLALLSAKQTETGSVRSDIYPDFVTGYEVAEDWIFDRNRGEMLVRIRDIAPTINRVNAIGESMPTPVFWVHYNDIREHLFHQFAYEADGTKYSFDDFFECREFRSRITKVSGRNEAEEEDKTEKHKSRRKNK